MSDLDEAEMAVLGAVLATGGECLDDLVLSGDDFYEPARGDLFDLMRRLHNSGSRVDQVILSEHAKDSGLVWAATEHLPYAGAVGSYARIVSKHALRRRLAAAGARLASLEADSDVELAELARKAVDDAVGDTKARVRFVGDVLPDVIERLQAGESFVPSPWQQLNGLIGGFRPGCVYVVGARPGEGKSVMAAQIAGALARHGVVAFSSLEMTEAELVQRIIAERLKIGVGKITDAKMSDLDWQALAAGKSDVASIRIAIDDRSGVSADDVRGFARQVSRHGKLAGVVVDYLQLMTARQRSERHLQVADFSRRLKIMAKDMRVPVIALSQLNRNSEQSSLAQPKLSDLRESGAIEQDADVVLLLHREGDEPNESLVVDVAKNRHGMRGEVRLAWEGYFSRAVDWS